MVPHVCHADLIAASVHLVLPCHQLLYTSGPAWLRTISLTQSLPGQPEAAPLSTAMHHGVVPPLLMVFCRVIMSCQLAGTVYPLAAKFLGSYQIRPLTAAHENIS